MLWDNTMQDKASTTAPTGLLDRLRQGLGRTRENLSGGLGRVLGRQTTLDPELIEMLEDHLLMADVGVETTQRLIQSMQAHLGRGTGDAQGALSAMAAAMEEVLTPCEVPLEIPAQNTPFVILVAGINGSGKTTTIAKLCRRLQDQGHSVMLAAGDTFRAAAVEQLQVWGQRHNVPVIAQHTGADSASVIYDACEAARARQIDVLIADTAGRLHTQTNLMEELRKIRRVLARVDPAAPHEVMLVLDAGIGQNALAQAREFNEAIGVTGITLTKLDGTARGGIVFTIADQLGIPLRFLGVGEQPEDLRPFVAREFVAALLDHEAGGAQP